MKYQIICDSCGDFTPEMMADPHFVSVPLTLEIGDYRIMDDENFDQADFLRRMAESSTGAKTACPSPDAFLKALEKTEAEEIYIVTISERLSGTYQAAKIAIEMYQEAHEDSPKKIHLFDSKAGTAGECKLCLDIQDYKERGHSFLEVVDLIEKECNEMATVFVLGSLENLRKNGRLSTMKTFIACALNIKPIMCAENGIIVKLDQQRGVQKALKRMVQIAIERAGGVEAVKEKRLVITHVNALERAEQVKADFLKEAEFKDIVITNAQGVATIYADNQGIVVAL